MNFKDRMKAKAVQRAAGIPDTPSAPALPKEHQWPKNTDGVPIEGKVLGDPYAIDPMEALASYPEEVYTYFLRIHRPGGDKIENINKALEWARTNGSYSDS